METYGIILALGLASLTGSKLVTQILNRTGHCISYSETKGLETEFAYSVAGDEHDAPDGIRLDPNVSTACVWDNNDANVETLDGKETLHATVGHTTRMCCKMMNRLIQIQSRFEKREIDGVLWETKEKYQLSRNHSIQPNLSVLLQQLPLIPLAQHSVHQPGQPSENRMNAMFTLRFWICIGSGN